MKTIEQELDEYMQGRTADERAAVHDTEAAIRWLCGRINELQMKMLKPPTLDECAGAERCAYDAKWPGRISGRQPARLCHDPPVVLRHSELDEWVENTGNEG